MVAIFTVQEARDFIYQGRKQLEDEDAYPDELIEEAAERITADFARICDVAFVPTTAMPILDGGGGPYLALPHSGPPATAGGIVTVASVERWNGEDWEDSGLTYRLMDDGTLLGDARWPWGRANLRVTYTHGYATPPAAVKRAALILAVDQLKGSNVSDRATQQTNEYGTYNLAVPGWRDGQWYGVPVVDSVLQRYSARGPAVG